LRRRRPCPGALQHQLDTVTTNASSGAASPAAAALIAGFVLGDWSNTTLRQDVRWLRGDCAVRRADLGQAISAFTRQGNHLRKSVPFFVILC